MQKCFLTAILFFSLISLKLFAQHSRMEKCTRDSLFRAQPHETQIQKALIYLQLAKIIQGDLPEKSFSYLVSAFRISILEKNDSLKATVRMRMGDYDARKRKFMLAHQQYLAAWKIYQSVGDTAGEVNALLRTGELNRTLTNYTKSLEYLQKGVSLVLMTNAKSMNGQLLLQMALTYQAMNDTLKAKFFFNKALSLFRQAADRKNEFRVQNHLGSIYLNEHRYDEALSFFNKLLHDADTSDLELMGMLYTRLGHAYDQKNDYRSSLKYNLKALETRRRYRGNVAITSSLINVAGDYYNLGNPDSGKVYMVAGMNQAISHDYKDLVVNGYRHLYTYYLNRKNYSRALDYYARYSSALEGLSYEQSRNNIAILEAIQRLQRIQQSGKKIARIRDIQSLNVKYHAYQSFILKILVSLAGFSMLVFVFLLLYVHRLRKKMQNLNVQLSEEIKEREATEEQTRERENQYRFITDNSVDFITHIDSEGNHIYASPASLNVYGYEPEEILNKTPHDLTHPDYYEYTDANYKELIETRSSRQFIYQALKKDGTTFWVESIITPLFDPISGEYRGIVGVTRDIQERKTKEVEIMEGTKQKENLLKEIHHRVKNNFAILVSLINMQIAQTKNQEVVQSLTNLQLRIRTMALVHEMLYRSNDFEKISFPGYLRSLASVIAGTYNRRDVALTVEADEVVMDIEASIPLGLIINEILSNAYKHAFPEGRAGKIEIHFTMDPDQGLSTLVLKDDGIGMPHGGDLDQFKTMGLQVVQILCTQVEATLLVANDPGAMFTITFKS